MNITIIGPGNMGGAMARGLYKSNVESKEKLNLTVSDIVWDKLNQLKAECPEVETMIDNRKAVENADVVIVAVKPWQLQSVLDGFKDLLTSEKILISFAAGIGVEDLQKLLAGSSVKNIFHIIPNIAAEFNESMSFVSAADTCTPEVIETVKTLFERVGSAYVCPEKLVGPGMLMASCGIAYVMRFIRVQMEAGVEMGFYPKESLNIAIQTMMGAAELLRSTGEHPEAAIDRVTTPGGYTIKGLNELDHSHFNSAVIKAFKTGF